MAWSIVLLSGNVKFEDRTMQGVMGDDVFSGFLRL